MQYTVLHLHTELSQAFTVLDSVNNYKQYVDKAKQLGMKSLAFTEHGNVLSWYSKKQYCEANGIKYIHGVELYITETLDERKPDNYHMLLLAKNKEGFKEINHLCSIASMRKDKIVPHAYKDGYSHHFYRVPRITYEELKNTSDNIIIATACLGGLLNKAPDYLQQDFIEFMTENKHRCFLEVQHHLVAEQYHYNQKLYEIHKQTGIPLVATTDTHALDKDYLDGRAMLQKSKNVYFGSEEGWDLTFKSYDELMNDFTKQQALPIEVYKEAMENTNKIADMVEPFDLDMSFKYPEIHENPKQALLDKLYKGLEYRGNYPLTDEVKERIIREVETFEQTHSLDFMLLDHEVKQYCIDNGIEFGEARGSAGGSFAGYLLGIHHVDPLKYNLLFERFMSKERVSLADIDTDYAPEDIPKIKSYLYGREDLSTCDIVTFNTIKHKGAVRDIARALGIDKCTKEEEPDRQKCDMIDRQRRANIDAIAEADISDFVKFLAKKSKQSDKDILRIIDSLLKEWDGVNPIEDMLVKKGLISQADADKFDMDIEPLVEQKKYRQEFPELFRYVDMLQGVVTSVGSHPAGVIVADRRLDEELGLFHTKDSEFPISQLDMGELEDLKYLKLDLLKLKTVGVINNTCELAGIERIRDWNTDYDDEAVWNDIKRDTIGIFQWEKAHNKDYLNKLISDETIEVANKHTGKADTLDLFVIGNAAIRPTGASYRYELAKGHLVDYGHKALNKLVSGTLSYVVFQEQIMEFLNKFCGFTLAEADVVRRALAGKGDTAKFLPQVEQGFLTTMIETYGLTQEQAESIVKPFLQVIKDSSEYGFNKSHSQAYSIIGYQTAWLRYYYPVEFGCSYFKYFGDNESNVSRMVAYLNKRGIKIYPPRFRYTLDEDTPHPKDKAIYKGMTYIKNVSKGLAQELWELRDNQYDNFVDLLVDIDKHTRANVRDLRILIELDFFKEFGNVNTLLKIVELFDWKDRRQMRKANLIDCPFPEYLVAKHSTKETPKTYTGVDFASIVREMVDTIDEPDYTIKEKIQAQKEYLGYVDVSYGIDGRYCYVDSISGKFKNLMVDVVSFYNSKNIRFKVNKEYLMNCGIDEGDIIYIHEAQRKPNWKPDGTHANGRMKFVQTGTFSWHINNATVITEEQLHKEINKVKEVV